MLTQFEQAAAGARGLEKLASERALQRAHMALMRTPWELRGQVVARLERAYNSRPDDAYFAWRAMQKAAVSFCTYTGPCNLPMGADPDAIDAQAEQWAKDITSLADVRLRRIEAEDDGIKDALLELYRECCRVTRIARIEPPALPSRNPAERDIAAGIRRMMDAKWWTAHARTAHGRWVEQVAQRNGFVGRNVGNPYVSWAALERYRAMRRRNRSILSELDAVCDELGIRIPLLQAVDASVANPKLRRAEMMLRVRGLDEWATAQGWSAEMWTITCPSRFHRWTEDSKGRVIDNPQWHGATPAEGQRYLRNVWARLRARLARQGIALCGLRVAEPHHDGCPHWHMLVFAPADALTAARKTAKRYALQDSPDEPGAERHRFRADDIDPEKGTAAGYIAKYIAKHIDPAGTTMAGQADHESGLVYDDITESAANRPEALDRVLAWASLWSIRQFQFFRAGPVTVWRELRRLSRDEGRRVAAMREAWEAANNEAYGGMSRADWMAFLRAIERHPLQVVTEQIASQYGDLREKVIGLECAGRIFITRKNEWRIERRQGDGPSAGALPAWTCDNNCTGRRAMKTAAGPPKKP